MRETTSLVQFLLLFLITLACKRAYEDSYNQTLNPWTYNYHVPYLQQHALPHFL